jgi:hypothetical protein
MTRSTPQAGCHDIDFREACVLDDPAEVALEDYAQTVIGSRRAEACRLEQRPAEVSGVHVCGAPEPPSPAAIADIEDFARDLVARSGGAGLGWS